MALGDYMTAEIDKVAQQDLVEIMRDLGVKLTIFHGRGGTIFGTKRIAQAGDDIGGMIKGIKAGVKDAEPVAEELRELGDDVNQLKRTANVQASRSHN